MMERKLSDDQGAGLNTGPNPIGFDFYARMRLVCLAIPAGHVATYGQIAGLCGKPRNHRQVGYALRTDRVGQVPAHRIVNAKGQLVGAFFFELPDLQRRLLVDEGVLPIWADGQWTVDLAKHLWRPSPAEVAALEASFAEAGI